MDGKTAYRDLAATATDEGRARLEDCILKLKVMLNGALSQHYTNHRAQKRGDAHYDFPGEDPSWQVDQMHKDPEISCYPICFYNRPIHDLSKRFWNDANKGIRTEFLRVDLDESEWRFPDLVNETDFEIIVRDGSAWDFCVKGLLPLRVWNPPDVPPENVWQARIRRKVGGDLAIDLAMQGPDMIRAREMESRREAKTRKAKREAHPADYGQIADQLAARHGIDPSEFEDIVKFRWERFEDPVISPVEGEEDLFSVTDRRPRGSPVFFVRNPPKGEVMSVKFESMIKAVFEVRVEEGGDG